MNKQKPVGCSGYVRANSGIGVVQRQTYPFLEQRVDLVVGRSRDLGSGLLARVGGLVAGLLPVRSGLSRYINLVSPMPFFIRARVTTVVHDLRWLRTRGRLSRVYRSWDLRRCIRGSEKLVCISERTFEDLVEFDPRARAKAVVQWEGPGLVPEDSFTVQSDASVLLIGGAPHKRNEIAAEALVAARPEWLERVIGIGVSPRVQEILSAALGEDACEWHARVSDDEMVSAYVRSQTYVNFGVEEGFGLPYVEALCAGANVVVIDQPLTRELLDDAAVYLRDGNVQTLAEQISSLSFVSQDVRQRRSELFSWKKFAEALL